MLHSWCAILTLTDWGYRPASLAQRRQLAERSGVGIATIVRVERNQVEPRGSAIRKLAEALGVEPEELVRTEG